VNDDLHIEKIDERFFVRGRMKILDILTDLAFRGEPVNVYFNSGVDRLETTLIDARDKSVFFEAGKDVDANRRLLQSASCIFIAYPDGIRIQFESGPVTSLDSDDDDAIFSIPLPERIARLQRQESFRLQIHAEQALSVGLTASDGSPLGKWSLHDLSTTGLGVSVDAESRHMLEEKLARASFELPEYGAIECAVTVRHVTRLVREKAAPSYRLGLRFDDLPAEMHAAIQRYIIKTEHERRNASAGAGGDSPTEI
jgi:c-di-GMP-binding flagellar brake protein YcgR